MGTDVMSKLIKAILNTVTKIKQKKCYEGQKAVTW